VEPLPSSRTESSAADVEPIRDQIVILAAPRSGSSALFAALSAHPDLWSLYRESNAILEGPFHPATRGWTSSALVAADLDGATRSELIHRFFDQAGNLERIPLARHLPIRGRGRRRISMTIARVSRPFKKAPIRLVEKSPKNSLRVPFMRALFPDARFVHLTRHPAANIASLYRAWLTPDRYKTYPMPQGFHIRGYDGHDWSFMLQPGWRAFDGQTLAEVCADQWRACNEMVLHDLADLATDATDRAIRIRFEELVADPAEALGQLASWAGLDPEPFSRFHSGLPVVQGSRPAAPEVRRQVRSEVDAVLDQVHEVAGLLGYS
jgi:hypothetical protein